MAEILFQLTLKDNGRISVQCKGPVTKTAVHVGEALVHLAEKRVVREEGDSADMFSSEGPFYVEHLAHVSGHGQELLDKVSEGYMNVLEGRIDRMAQRSSHEPPAGGLSHREDAEW